MKKINWHDVRFFSISALVTLGFVVLIAISLVSCISDSIDTITDKYNKNKRIRESYKYIEDHYVLDDLESLYSIAEDHITCDDFDFSEFEDILNDVYQYCEAAEYIAENRNE